MLLANEKRNAENNVIDSCGKRTAFKIRKLVPFPFCHSISKVS